jgi:hypothetical protein
MTSSKDYEVLSVNTYDKYKNLHLRCLQDETQHTVTAFPDFAEYHKLEVGYEVNGWIRIKNSYYTLTDYCKPERNWADNEKFI